MHSYKTISWILIAAMLNAVLIAPAMAVQEQSVKPTVAILNFQSNTGDESIDAMLATGSAETIISDLSVIEEITVVERNKIVAVMKEIELGQSGMLDDETAQQAGRLMGVQYILMGHWQKFGNRFRVNARLVEVETGEIVVSIKETGDENSVFDLQDNISEQILSNLRITVSEQDKAKIHKRETLSLDAYKEFSKGLRAYDTGDRDATNYYMNRALEYDPDYAKPKEYIWVAGNHEKKNDAIEKALGFDQAKTKEGFIIKQVIYGAVGLGGAAYLATSIGDNKPEGEEEIKTRNKLVLGLAAFGALTGLVIGLASKKVEKK